MGLVKRCGDPTLGPATDRRIMRIKPEGCPQRGVHKITCQVPRQGNRFKVNYGRDSDHHLGISSQHARTEKKI